MPYPTQQIRFCRSRDGTRIAYAVCGNGPPLVWVQHWVHHLNFDWEHPVWQPWLAFLTRRHRVIRYDWRGCGLSDRDQVELSVVRYAEDLDAVINAAGVERCILFGMAGSGSAAAIDFVADRPEKVSHLVISGAHTHGRLARNPPPVKFEETEARLKLFELGWSSEMPAYGQFFTALHIPDGTTEQMRAYDDLLRRTTSSANAVSLIRSFQKTEIGASVLKVSCPTLVLHSRGDCIIPFEKGREVATLIAGAHFVPLDSRNHILLGTESAWAEMTTAVEEFLAAVAPPSPALVLDELTAREREILEAMAQGLDNDGISKCLNISEKTVRNHVSTVMSKLGVTSRPQAIVRARDAGFGRSTSRSS
jgi:pimeloyl-ACP methyl ester carboxylesterase/DNA-binding CsgD family transcriptional regulator